MFLAKKFWYIMKNVVIKIYQLLYKIIFKYHHILIEEKPTS